MKSAFVALASTSLLLLSTTPARAEYCRADLPEDQQSEVCIARHIYFLPGVQGVVFAPAAAGGDPFMGGGVQLSPLHWSANNDNFGPSQGALFTQVSLLSSSQSESTLALWDVGVSLSLERNSSRRFAIPYFGATLGALSHETLPDSSYTYTFLGLHAYWHHHLVVNLEGGYHFPFTDVDLLRGPRAQLTVRFSMW
jgi:hypothetical protein